MFIDETASYLEPNQGDSGTCYFAASISGAAEYPELITDMFITGIEDNVAGIYMIKFFIRGKPWLVTVDEKLLFDTINDEPVHMNPADNGAMWAVIMEKAWAKAKGSYGQANGGFVVSGLRAVTGAPTFTYILDEDDYSLTSD